MELSEDVLEKEDKESQMDFLESMKEGFLRQLNLSDVPQEDRKISPSQFMVELYNKYSSNRSAVPQFDVIRSFAVQGTDSDGAFCVSDANKFIEMEMWLIVTIVVLLFFLLLDTVRRILFALRKHCHGRGLLNELK